MSAAQQFLFLPREHGSFSPSPPAAVTAVSLSSGQNTDFANRREGEQRCLPVARLSVAAFTCERCAWLLSRDSPGQHSLGQQSSKSSQGAGCLAPGGVCAAWVPAGL